jgi:hypothetical protein
MTVWYLFEWPQHVGHPVTRTIPHFHFKNVLNLIQSSYSYIIFSHNRNFSCQYAVMNLGILVTSFKNRPSSDFCNCFVLQKPIPSDPYNIHTWPYCSGWFPFVRDCVLATVNVSSLDDGGDTYHLYFAITQPNHTAPHFIGLSYYWCRIVRCPYNGQSQCLCVQNLNTAVLLFVYLGCAISISCEPG